MMKRILAALLMLLIVQIPLACADTCAKNVQIEGAIFGGRSDDRIAAEVVFDTDWLTEADNTLYNPDLAAFSALLCADSYYREKDLAKGTQNRVVFEGETEYDWTSFLKAAGFTDVRHVESFREKEYSADGNDSATLTMGHRVVEDRFDVYAVVFRGCFSSQEWLSVFDPGSVSAAYEACTGAHPEWTDAQHFKGLDIAANRAEEFIRAFKAEYDRPDLPDRILITGHSRGGSLANIVGAHFEKSSAAAYTYAFNSMPVTADADAAGYRTIFNLFDSGDFYTDVLPFGQEPFYRYGTEKTLRIEDYPEIRTKIAAMKGRDDFICVSPETQAAYRSMFGDRFPDRESLYEAVTVTQIFDTEEAAAARLEECLACIGGETGLDLGKFCRMGGISETGDGKYALEMEYCGAALLWSYSKVLAYGSAACDMVLSLFSEDAAACRIAELLLDNLPAITGGHLLINTYILSGTFD